MPTLSISKHAWFKTLMGMVKIFVYTGYPENWFWNPENWFWFQSVRWLNSHNASNHLGPLLLTLLPNHDWNLAPNLWKRFTRMTWVTQVQSCLVQKLEERLQREPTYTIDAFIEAISKVDNTAQCWEQWSCTVKNTDRLKQSRIGICGPMHGQTITKSCLWDKHWHHTQQR